MKFVSFSIKVVVYIVGVVLLFYGLVVAINLPMFDEELNPEVAKVLKTEPMPAPESNAYIAMLGIEAPNDQDMFKIGLQLLERYRQNIEKNGLYSFIDPLSKQDREEILANKHNDEKWRELYRTNKICGFKEKTDCLSRLSIFIRDNPIVNARLKFLFKRYERLLTLTDYKSPNKVTTHTGLMGRHTLEYARLKLADLYNSKEKNKFLSFLEKDIAYRKMVLLKSESLIDKMVSLSLIKTNLDFLSNFIREQNLSDFEEQKITEILVNFSKEERDISKSYEHELKFVDYYIRQNIHFAGIWRSGFQLNASLNDTYINITEPLKCISKLPANKFYRIYKRQSTESVCNHDKLEQGFTRSLTDLYNFSYKVGNKASRFRYMDFIARAHDTDGMINLLQLQLQLKSVSKNLRTEFILNSDIKNPYTGTPLEFNENTGILKFDCLSQGRQDDCNIRI